MSLSFNKIATAAAFSALSFSSNVLACATCGCSLSSDGALGYTTTAGWSISIDGSYINQNQLRSGTSTISPQQVQAISEQELEN